MPPKTLVFKTDYNDSTLISKFLSNQPVALPASAEQEGKTTAEKNKGAYLIKSASIYVSGNRNFISMSCINRIKKVTFCGSSREALKLSIACTCLLGAPGYLHS